MLPTKETERATIAPIAPVGEPTRGTCQRRSSDRLRT
jgi:hypothetical protein